MEDVLYLSIFVEEQGVQTPSGDRNDSLSVKTLRSGDLLKAVWSQSKGSVIPASPYKERERTVASWAFL